MIISFFLTSELLALNFDSGGYASNCLLNKFFPCGFNRKMVVLDTSFCLGGKSNKSSNLVVSFGSPGAWIRHLLIPPH